MLPRNFKCKISINLTYEIYQLFFSWLVINRYSQFLKNNFLFAEKISTILNENFFYLDRNRKG